MFLTTVWTDVLTIATRVQKDGMLEIQIVQYSTPTLKRNWMRWGGKLFTTVLNGTFHHLLEEWEMKNAVRWILIIAKYDAVEPCKYIFPPFVHQY